MQHPTEASSIEMKMEKCVFLLFWLKCIILALDWNSIPNYEPVFGESIHASHSSVNISTESITIEISKSMLPLIFTNVNLYHL